MSAGQDINSIMQRTRRYWYEDGFADLGMGALLFVLGLLFAAEAITPTGSPLWFVWSFGWPIVLIGGSVLVTRVVQQLKARYTYPRTGYVSYERQGGSRVVQMIAVFLVAALIAAGVVAFSRGWQNLTLWFGLAFTAAFTFVGFRAGLVRYLALALLSLIVGLALMPLALTTEQTSALFFVALGLGMVVSGLSAWLRISRTTPPGGEASDGRPS